MSEQAPTPNIGLVLPIPNTGQPWSTVKYVSNMTAIDTAFGTDRSRLTSLEASRDPANIGSRGVPGGSTSARDAFWGQPSDDAGALTLQNKGALWWNVGNEWLEAYFGKYDATTNKGGAAARGWYPIAGKLPRARLFVVATGGINGVGQLQYCLTRDPYMQAPANDALRSVAYDKTTGKLTPAVVGKYKAKTFFHLGGDADGQAGFALSVNSTTNPTSSPAGQAKDVNGVVRTWYTPFRGGYTTKEFTELDFDTASAADFVQLWASATTSSPFNINAQMVPWGFFFDLSYVGPPTVDH